MRTSNFFAIKKNVLISFDQAVRRNDYTGTTIQITSPTEELLQKVNLSEWPVWKCIRPLWANLTKVYEDQITFYAIQGNAKVIPSGKYADHPIINIEPRKLYTFPEGFSCRWEVEEDVIKHYHIPVAVDLEFPGLIPSPRMPKDPN